MAKNQSKAGSKLVFFAQKGGISFIDGYQNEYKNVTHRRQVMFVRPNENADGYFIVGERLTGQGEHQFDQYWHTFPTKEIKFDTVDELAAWTKNDDKLGEILIQAIKTDDTEMKSTDSFVSYQYNSKTERPAIKYSKKYSVTNNVCNPAETIQE